MINKIFFNNLAIKADEGNEDEARFRWRLTEKMVDRHGDVVVPDGMVVDKKKNDIPLFFGHAQGWNIPDEMPIGIIDTKTFDVNDKFVEADIVLHRKTELSEQVFQMIKGGFLKAGSIGFKPLEVGNEPIMPKQTGKTFLKWEIIEFSIVPIPALPSALIRNSYQKPYNDFYTFCKTDLGPEKANYIFTKSLDNYWNDGGEYVELDSTILDVRSDETKQDNSELINLFTKQIESLNAKIDELIKTKSQELKPADEPEEEHPAIKKMRNTISKVKETLNS